MQDESLKKAVDSALEDLEGDGALRDLRRRWALETP
jgi:hypothetical protein